MNKISKITSRFAAIAFSVLLLASCNKGLDEIGGQPPLSDVNTGTLSPLKALYDTLKTSNGGNDSLFYYLLQRAGTGSAKGLLDSLNNKNLNFTVFVPTNAAVRQFITAIAPTFVPAGSPDALYKGFILTGLPADKAYGIVRYNIIPQAVPSSAIPTTFPNFPYPTLINPAPTVSALLRLDTYPSNRNGYYVNNYPLVKLDGRAGNGIFHEVAGLPLPPTEYLWNRINSDTTGANGLAYFRAAILRADSGVAISNPGSLQGALLNIGANLTVYAPIDSAFRITLTGAIYQGLVAQGVPPAIALSTAQALAATPAVFSNPALYSSLSAQSVKGIVVYHIMGVRAFNNNLPTTQTYYPTLLNTVFPTHPGIGLKAVFAGTFVAAATVKGVGNSSPSNILINPTPAPNGSSDQNYLNGVLHKIDQALLPQ